MEPETVTGEDRPTDEGVITRRDLVRVGVGSAAGAAVAGGLLSRALEAMAAPAVPGAGPYGPLGSPDSNGIRLPVGFTSREIARTGRDIGPDHLYGPNAISPGGMSALYAWLQSLGQ